MQLPQLSQDFSPAGQYIDIRPLSPGEGVALVATRGEPTSEMVRRCAVAGERNDINILHITMSASTRQLRRCLRKSYAVAVQENMQRPKNNQAFKGFPATHLEGLDLLIYSLSSASQFGRSLTPGGGSKHTIQCPLFRAI